MHHLRHLLLPPLLLLVGLSRQTHFATPLLVRKEALAEATRREKTETVSVC